MKKYLILALVAAFLCGCNNKQEAKEQAATTDVEQAEKNDPFNGRLFMDNKTSQAVAGSSNAKKTDEHKSSVPPNELFNGRQF